MADSWLGRSRGLNPEERALAQTVFQGALDLDRVRVTIGGPFSMGAPKALLWTLHMPRQWRGQTLVGPDDRMAPEWMHILLHELVHVWQYQHGGRGYMGRSLLAQALAILSGKGRRGAYRFEDVLDQPWASWNPEQQATAVEWWCICSGLCEYNKTVEDRQIWVTRLSPYVDIVRRGEGAPQGSPLGAGIGAAPGLLAGIGLGLGTGDWTLGAVLGGLIAAVGARLGWR